ncbi:protein kinase [Desulfobacterales bacterium HSG2]|nr:protein kinase [Desulfobacterales bacterium HSG2]
MIVKCEECQVAFNVNDNLIKPGGSKLRCSKCKHIFTIYPPEPSPPPPEISNESDRFSPFSSGDTLTYVDFSQDVFDIGSMKERYVEMGTIGKGGMGEVILARDTQLLRKVAIKVLRKEAASPAALSFFIREAQVTAQLDHPNIVPLYTVRPAEGDEKNVSFIMKLVKGKTLFDLLSRARTAYTEQPKPKLPQELEQRTVIEHFLKACDGITYAHRKQVVHRDLKPANIMVGDFGEVYVMDWGIAKMLKDEEQELTTQGTEIFTGDVARSDGSGLMTSAQPEGVVGTLSYMSPEQARGKLDVNVSSDIFSLGAVLYEVVTLKPARVGDSKKKLEWAKEGYLNEVSHISPEKKVDPELKAIIHKATEFDPDDRYPTVADMSEDIRCYLRGDEVSELPDNLVRKVFRWMVKHRQLTMILFLTMLLVSAAVTIGSLYREQEAMKAAQIRENKLSHLQAGVSAQAHYIDIHFLRLEDLAVNLANNAMYLIQDGPPNNERFYWIQDFQGDPAKAPPDHKYSKLYQKLVSIDYPVVKVAPGVLREDVAELMQRLAPLRHHFRRTLLDSRPGFAPISEEEAYRLLTVHGIPIRWAFIGLEDGVMYSYPGKGTYSDEYDPRVRPWYELGAHKQGVHWGNPYLDIQGLGLVLPCATSLYDKENRFYGVLGMDVTFSDIIEDYLTRGNAVGVIESFLLDDRGRIVVRSRLDDVDESSTEAGLQLKPFHVPEVVEAIQKSESGLREVERDGKTRIIVFYRISSLKWYYVEEVDTSAILRSASE